MMQNKLIKAVLPGIFVASFCVVGCTRMQTDEVYYDEAYYEDETAPVQLEENDYSCGADDDCLLTNDDGLFLTEEFTETYVVSQPGTLMVDTSAPVNIPTTMRPAEKAIVTNGEISASRPAAMKATAVKDKVVSQSETVSEKPSSQGSVTAVASVPLVEETTTTEVIEKEAPPAPIPLVKKITTTEVVESGVVAKSEPARKVVTTVSEKKTTSRIDAKTGEKIEVKKEESSITAEGTTLASRVAYGEEIHEWEAIPGTTLRALLLEWGEKSGWTVIWKMDRDYLLEAGVVFRGTFMEVAGALVRSFARAVPAPIGTFYQGNRVLVINTQEDENAH